MTAEMFPPSHLRPLPVPSPESKAFWLAARNHNLVLPHCNQCCKFWFPPSCLCPHCLSADTSLQESNGRGKVHTFAVFHRANHPAFTNCVPYVVAVIELDEGPRLLSNITDVDPDKVHCGMRVFVRFIDLSTEIALPVFSPCDACAERNDQAVRRSRVSECS